MPQEVPVFTLKNLYNVLVVCGGNTCRSPMATIVLQEFLDRAFREHINLPTFVVSSAGLADGNMEIPNNATGLPASEHVVRLMRNHYRINLSAHVSRPVWTLPKEERATIIVAMSVSVAETLKNELPKPDAWDLSFPRKKPHILVMNEERGGIADPIGRDFNAYKQCLREIQSSVPEVATKTGRIVAEEIHALQRSFFFI